MNSWKRRVRRLLHPIRTRDLDRRIRAATVIPGPTKHRPKTVERQDEVVRLRATGMSWPRIGRELGLSTSYVQALWKDAQLRNPPGRSEGDE